MNAPEHQLIGVACAMALQELDLYVIEWIEIRGPIPDRSRQKRIAF
jgi:hypothetical protein